MDGDGAAAPCRPRGQRLLGMRRPHTHAARRGSGCGAFRPMRIRRGGAFGGSKALNPQVSSGRAVCRRRTSRSARVSSAPSTKMFLSVHLSFHCFRTLHLPSHISLLFTGRTASPITLIAWPAESAFRRSFSGAPRSTARRRPAPPHGRAGGALLQLRDCFVLFRLSRSLAGATRRRTPAPRRGSERCCDCGILRRVDPARTADIPTNARTHRRPAADRRRRCRRGVTDTQPNGSQGSPRITRCARHDVQ